MRVEVLWKKGGWIIRIGVYKNTASIRTRRIEILKKKKVKRNRNNNRKRRKEIRRRRSDLWMEIEKWR